MNYSKFIASRIKDHKSNIVTKMWNIQQKLDDVIAMGGTFDRLVSHGNEVNGAYQTSGNIAVSNEDASKFLEVTHDLSLIQI